MELKSKPNMNIYDSISDQELLSSLKDGDRIAFNILYNRYWKKTLTVALHKVNDVPEAESIVQDIFLSLWKRRDQLDINSNFNNYLMASVKYRVIKYLNKQRNKRIYEEQAIASTELFDDSTQEHLEFEELRQRLQALVEQLPETCQLIYRLNKDEGKSYKEISVQLSISEKSVDGHLSRAKKVLWSGLNKYLMNLL